MEISKTKYNGASRWQLKIIIKGQYISTVYAFNKQDLVIHKKELLKKLN
jgi:hypothetical protein